MRARALAFAVLAGLAAGATAQGLPAWGTFQGGKISFVDVSSLQTHIKIPMINKAGRGLRFVYPITIDGVAWHSSSQPPDSGTWLPFSPGVNSGAVGPVFGGTDFDETQASCTDQYGINTDYYNIYTNYIFTDPNGVNHYFDDPSTGEPVVTEDPFPYDCDPAQDPGYPDSTSGLATDSSGFALPYVNGSNPGTVVGPDGTQYAGGLVDRSGNEITASGSSTVTFTDTLGVNALTVSGTAATQMTYSYPNPQGGTSSYVVSYTPMNLQSHFGCGLSEYGYASYFPTLITLPDSTTYQISWEPTPGYGAGYTTGRVALITLPNGGKISYSYPGAHDGADCSTYKMSALQQTTPDGTTTYNGSGSQMTVTDPQGNQTVYTFDGTFKTERQVYDSTHTLLMTESVCYDGYVGTCPGAPGTRGVNLIDDQTELPNGQWWATWATMNATAGGPSEVDEAIWGTGVVRKALTTFATNPNWPGLPAQVTVEDGGGAVESQISYTYDESTPVATTGTPNHVAGTGGNATTVSFAVGNGTTLAKHFTYFDTGNVDTATDVNGSPTKIIYGACGNSFPTTVDEAVAGLSRDMTWDCNGGVETSAKDENGQATTTNYADANFWRPTSVVQPDGTQTVYRYTGAASEEQVTTFNGGNSTDDELVTFDGMERAELMQKRQSPTSANWDSVEILYDTDGRAYKTSMPYTGTVGQLGATAYTTTLFDALGRPASVTDAGGGYTDYAYTNNDVLVTRGPAPAGENTKRKQLELDGFGHILSVCEITSGTGSGTCGQGTNQTGYWTEYTYNPKGQITSVVQNAQGTSQETRTFVYDNLGRMTAETTPESGTTTFSFDTGTTSCPAGSIGDLVQRQDAAGNITCYSYDAMHRVTQIGYPSGPNAAATPTKSFYYDNSTGWGLTNTEGRMYEAFTGPANAPITVDLFGFDTNGRTVQAWQATPSSGGWEYTNATDFPNGAPATLSAPGVPAITYGLDGEGRPAMVSAAGQGQQQPVTSATYSPLGLTALALGSQDADSYQYDAATGRMTQYSFDVNGVSDTGVLSWNADGSLKQLAINDLIPGTSDSATCTYSQDDLGRLASAGCPGQNQTFTYDAFGNMTTTPNPGYGFSASFNLKNQIASVGGFAPVYDSDGNLTSDPVAAHNNVNAFDAEGKPVSFEGAAVTYDALGRGVEFTAGGVTREIVYGPGGGKLALMDGQTLEQAEIPLPGGGAAVYNAGGLAFYRHADALGSSRLASTPARTLYSSTAYTPYGQPFDQAGTADPNFTGQDQTYGGDQYNFLERNLSPIQGRWWTPDPAGMAAADPTNPQTWNRYAYVADTPLTSTDPLGLDTGPPVTSLSLPCGGDGLCIPLFPCLHDWACSPDFCFGYGICPGDTPDPGSPGGGGNNAAAPAMVMANWNPKGPACISPASIDLILANTPMAGEGQDFFDAGQKYNVNPGLAVAIAGAESTFGEQTNTTWGLFNAWGWGGPGAKGWTIWSQGIVAIDHQLADKVYMAGNPPLTTSAEIYGKWCQSGDCAGGLKTINAILAELGVDPGSLRFPACAENE